MQFLVKIILIAFWKGINTKNIAVKKLTSTIDNISLNNLKYFYNYLKKLILILINIEIYKDIK